MDPREVKDRILENINLSVKKLQSYFAACEDETPAIRNHDRVLQRLCEHLDHALLYGLQDISSGYWVLVVHFTRREAVKQIEEQQHVATLLGRSRAWLYLALNENSLESYLRLFQENQTLLQKYYYKNALVCSHDHLTLFLTLVSGLEFIRFDLELDVPYLDLAPYMPEYYKPQYLLDFEDRLPSNIRGSDSLSLNSFNSINSANLEWDDSAIAPSSEDGEVPDGSSFPCPPPFLLAGLKSHSGNLVHRYNPFTQDLSSSDVTPGPGTAADTPDTSDPITQDSEVDVTSLSNTTLSYNQPTRASEAASDSTDLSTQDVADGLSTSESTPVHSASRKANFTTYTENHAELEVIRMVRKKRGGKRKKVRSEDGGPRSLLSTSEPEEPDPNQRQVVCNGEMTEKPTELVEPALRLAKMQDTSMERVGQPLTEVIEKLNGQLDPQSWSCNPESTDHPFRTCSPGETPGDPQSQDVSKGLQDPMDFYYFTPESPYSATAGGGDNDSPGPSQPTHVFGGLEDVGQTEEGRGSETSPTEPIEDQSSQTLLTTGSGGKGSPSLSVAEDSGVEEGQGSPTDAPHPCEFRVDNNLLLLLMIHVFRENEEQLFKMFRMSTGHMEGDLQLVYVLLTDCYIYLLRKGAADKPYMVEDAVSYNELDYVSVGLDQQAVTIVCTNRRRQFLVDTADVSLTEIFISALKSAMINGCREPPYPGVLTDATMERLALAKFVSQESKREASEVVMLYYGLVHWEDPLDEMLGSDVPATKDQTVTKEGVLHYRAGTSLLGWETWKSCYVVLSNGILYQYPDRTDVIPMLSINLGGEQCGGCRRANTTERPHSFQVILTDQPSLELSAANEEDMADWMLHLCQAVSKGVIPQGGVPSPCLPCCLVLTDDKLITCHQDCQTSFFRALGVCNLMDLSSLGTVDGKEYCVMEFAQECSTFLPPWVVYFSCRQELERFISIVGASWKSIYQVDLPHKPVCESSVKKCEEALSLIHSAWQRSDSLCRGRSSRDPWC
ncbi:pleckstrin homology domain-containing family M member 2 isoform X2 [Hyperolius riggenbachi]|uniref:pleckstrin homology domain-containing family M member 2 isoform X2 n=1 Tax=Hyperolius riggenbachi TaxID=752182 RepID=UPI0035A2EEFF